MRIRLVGNEADRPTLGARAIQGSLRPAQNLDPVDVDQPGLRVTLVPRDGDDRNLVHIDADGRIADRRADAANGDVVLSRSVRPIVVGCEGDARHDARDVFEVFDMKRLDAPAVQDANTDGHVLRVLFPLVRGDDHLGEGTGIVARIGGGRVSLGRGDRADDRECGEQTAGNEE